MEEEILVAEIYRRDYNRHIDLVRLNMHNRHKRKKDKQLSSFKHS